MFQIPIVTADSISTYFQLFGQSLQQMSVRMYNEKFLVSARHADMAGFSYIKGRVKAEYRVDTVYTVDVKLDHLGVINESQCECGAGSAPTAHCKHVGVVLYALTKSGDGLLTSETCTQKLQTFHKTKKFKGSPMKLHQLNLRKNGKLSNLSTFDPRPQQFQGDPGYTSHFRNTVLNSNACKGPIRQLFSQQMFMDSSTIMTTVATMRHTC